MTTRLEWITDNPADRPAGPHARYSMGGRFTIAPNPAPGFKFSGWLLTDGATAQVSFFRKLADAKAAAEANPTPPRHNPEVCLWCRNGHKFSPMNGYPDAHVAGANAREPGDPAFLSFLSDIRVDLKWSAWSASPDHWDEHAPGVLAYLRALPFAKPCRILTAPRKEVRFGEITVTRWGTDRYVGGQSFTACGLFWNEDDDDNREEVDVNEEAPTLRALLAKVDRREALILSSDVTP